MYITLKTALTSAVFNVINFQTAITLAKFNTFSFVRNQETAKVNMATACFEWQTIMP